MNSKQMEMMAREHDMTAVNAEFAEEVADTVVKGAVGTYQKIENAEVGGYKKIEGGVVEGFTGMVDKMSGVMLDEEGNLKTGKVGEAVVGAYKKVENAFVNTFMTKEGETAEEAKARVTAGTEARQAKIKADMEAREAAQKAMIEKNLEDSRNAGKRN